MAARFNPLEADSRWQQIWEENGTFRASGGDGRPRAYVLEMFPYPSGRIHMGHVRNYTMGDVVARFKRATGNAVLHPMGWDAFGMPAENAAMLVAREYRKVNWDPVDMTVLANEQVIDGRGWRSGALVEQRDLYQWVFKISDYAEELLEALDTLDRWPDKVRLMQKNWIGKSEGLLVRFMLDPNSLSNLTTPNAESELEIFTTRPDTLFGAKFMAVAPDHPLAKAAAAKNPKLAAFIEECKRIGTSQEAIDTAEKMGFDTGVRAAPPFDPRCTL